MEWYFSSTHSRMNLLGTSSDRLLFLKDENLIGLIQVSNVWGVRTLAIFDWAWSQMFSMGKPVKSSRDGSALVAARVFGGEIRLFPVLAATTHAAFLHRVINRC